MKILNEEHFENVKRYAESIGDTSLQKCLERLKSWEGNPDYPSEISLNRQYSISMYGLDSDDIYRGFYTRRKFCP